MKLINPQGDIVAEADQISYNTEKQGWEVAGTVFSDPNKLLTLDAANPKIGPIAFQMLFKVEELVAIDAAKGTDPVVRIFWNLLNDPRTDVVDRNLKMVQDGLRHLETKNLIGAGRAQEILTGEVAK